MRSSRFLGTVFAIGAILSAVAGAVLVDLAGDRLIAGSPEESALTNYSVTFELRVPNPAGVSLAEETGALKGLQTALSEQFPELEATSMQTLEGYEIQVAGSMGGRPDKQDLSAIYSAVKSFSADYVSNHYRAKLVFQRPFNFSLVEATEAVDAANFSPTRFLTGGVFGVALFSLLFLIALMLYGASKPSLLGKDQHSSESSF